MTVERGGSHFFKARVVDERGGNMQDIAWVFKKLNQNLSETELENMLTILDRYIYEKTLEYYGIEAQIQLVQSAKIQIERALENHVIYNSESPEYRL